MSDDEVPASQSPVRGATAVVLIPESQPDDELDPFDRQQQRQQSSPSHPSGSSATKRHHLPTLVDDRFPDHKLPRQLDEPARRIRPKRRSTSTSLDQPVSITPLISPLKDEIEVPAVVMQPESLAEMLDAEAQKRSKVEVAEVVFIDEEQLEFESFIWTCEVDLHSLLLWKPKPSSLPSPFPSGQFAENFKWTSPATSRITSLEFNFTNQGSDFAVARHAVVFGRLISLQSASVSDDDLQFTFHNIFITLRTIVFQRHLSASLMNQHEKMLAQALVFLELVCRCVSPSHPEYRLFWFSFSNCLSQLQDKMMILGQFLESTVVTWTCFILSSMIRCVSHIDAIGLNINCKSARDPNVWNFCEFEASLVGIDEFSVTSISQRWQRLIVHSMLQLFAWTLPESGCWTTVATDSVHAGPAQSLWHQLWHACSDQRFSSPFWTMFNSSVGFFMEKYQDGKKRDQLSIAQLFLLWKDEPVAIRTEAVLRTLLLNISQIAMFDPSGNVLGLSTVVNEFRWAAPTSNWAVLSSLASALASQSNGNKNAVCLLFGSLCCLKMWAVDNSALDCFGQIWSLFYLATFQTFPTSSNSKIDISKASDKDWHTVLGFLRDSKNAEAKSSKRRRHGTSRRMDYAHLVEQIPASFSGIQKQLASFVTWLSSRNHGFHHNQFLLSLNSLGTGRIDIHELDTVQLALQVIDKFLSQYAIHSTVSNVTVSFPSTSSVKATNSCAFQIQSSVVPEFCARFNGAGVSCSSASPPPINWNKISSKLCFALHPKSSILGFPESLPGIELLKKLVSDHDKPYPSAVTVATGLQLRLILLKHASSESNFSRKLKDLLNFRDSSAQTQKCLISGVSFLLRTLLQSDQDITTTVVTFFEILEDLLSIHRMSDLAMQNTSEPGPLFDRVIIEDVITFALEELMQFTRNLQSRLKMLLDNNKDSTFAATVNKLIQSLCSMLHDSVFAILSLPSSSDSNLRTLVFQYVSIVLPPSDIVSSFCIQSKSTSSAPTTSAVSVVEFDDAELLDFLDHIDVAPVSSSAATAISKSELQISMLVPFCTILQEKFSPLLQNVLFGNSVTPQKLIRVTESTGVLTLEAALQCYASISAFLIQMSIQNCSWAHILSQEFGSRYMMESVKSLDSGSEQQLGCIYLDAPLVFWSHAMNCNLNILNSFKLCSSELFCVWFWVLINPMFSDSESRTAQSYASSLRVFDFLMSLQCQGKAYLQLQSENSNGPINHQLSALANIFATSPLPSDSDRLMASRNQILSFGLVQLVSVFENQLVLSNARACDEVRLQFEHFLGGKLLETYCRALLSATVALPTKAATPSIAPTESASAISMDLVHTNTSSQVQARSRSFNSQREDCLVFICRAVSTILATCAPCLAGGFSDHARSRSFLEPILQLFVWSPPNQIQMLLRSSDAAKKMRGLQVEASLVHLKSLAAFPNSEWKKRQITSIFRDWKSERNESRGVDAFSNRALQALVPAHVFNSTSLTSAELSSFHTRVEQSINVRALFTDIVVYPALASTCALLQQNPQLSLPPFCDRVLGLLTILYDRISASTADASLAHSILCAQLRKDSPVLFRILFLCMLNVKSVNSTALSIRNFSHCIFQKLLGSGDQSFQPPLFSICRFIQPQLQNIHFSHLLCLTQLDWKYLIQLRIVPDFHSAVLPNLFRLSDLLESCFNGVALLLALQSFSDAFESIAAIIRISNGNINSSVDINSYLLNAAPASLTIVQHGAEIWSCQSPLPQFVLSIQQQIASKFPPMYAVAVESMPNQRANAPESSSQDYIALLERACQTLACISALDNFWRASIAQLLPLIHTVLWFANHQRNVTKPTLLSLQAAFKATCARVGVSFNESAPFADPADAMAELVQSNFM